MPSYIVAHSHVNYPARTANPLQTEHRAFPSSATPTHTPLMHPQITALFLLVALVPLCTASPNHHTYGMIQSLNSQRNRWTGRQRQITSNPFEKRHRDKKKKTDHWPAPKSACEFHPTELTTNNVTGVQTRLFKILPLSCLRTASL